MDIKKTLDYISTMQD